MRGMILLALGGALIWMGVSLGARGEGVRDSVHAGEPGEEVDSVSDPGSDLAAEPEADLPSSAGERGPDQEPGPVDESSTEAPYPSEAEAAPARFEPAAPEEEPLAVLTSGSTTQTLSVLFLEAWIQGDPGPLQAFLNDETVALRPDIRSLVVTFWETLVGAAPEEGADAKGRGGTGRGARALLRSAAPQVLAGGDVPQVDVSRDPLARAMRMVLLMEGLSLAAEEGASSRAALHASDLIQLELMAPWDPHRDALGIWTQELNRAQDQHRLHPDGVWPSLPYLVESGDNLVDIRKRFLAAHEELRTCVGLLRKVNAVGKYLHPGDTLRIPTDRPNAIVFLEARLLVYRHGTEAVRAWSVGIGKEGHDTPCGEFLVGEKQFEPSWMPSGGPALPYGHPDNPLGTRWIGWHRGGEKTSFGIHGTKNPDGVGERVSQGCIRMRNEDVEELYELLPQGSQIRVFP